MQYRPEIDGLRAVAVLSVILFHAGAGIFAGGYVGVDVFFVISGYLITRILIDEIGQGSFSIARFYERRARRILPALFVVLLACIPFAYLWMLPSQLQDFSASLVTAVLGLSNLFFLSQLDYFAPDAALAPLLHTWSLAIEEQYYLFFPLFLLAMRRFGRNWTFVAIVGLVLSSFLFAEWAREKDAGRSFFFTLSRFWQIGAGSICAFLAAGRAQRSSNFLAMAGLLLILFTVFRPDADLPVPGAQFTVPVAGAMLVILFAGAKTWVARLLSLRPIVGVGLISYSAYLWHQPLFAFASLRSLTPPGPVLMGGLSVLSLVLAWATWRFVEQPFRRRVDPILPARRSVYVASRTGISLFIVLGMSGYVGQGFPRRLDPDVLRYARDNIDRAPPGPCFLRAGDEISYPNAACRFAGSAIGLQVLLAGDSHAMALSEGIGEALQAADIGYYYASYSGCVPLPKLRPFGQIADRDCLTFNARLYEYAKAEGISTIVMAARFPWYYRGAQFDNGEGGVESGEPAWVDRMDIAASPANDEARRARVLATYESEIRELAGSFNLVLVYPAPEAGWDVPQYMFRNTLFNGAGGTLTTSYAAYERRTREVNALFDRLSAELATVYPARIQDALCDRQTGRCINANAQAVYYFDDNHLSNTGARLVAPIIFEAIEAALAVPR